MSTRSKPPVFIMLTASTPSRATSIVQPKTCGGVDGATTQQNVPCQLSVGGADKLGRAVGGVPGDGGWSSCGRFRRLPPAGPWAAQTTPGQTCCAQCGCCCPWRHWSRRRRHRCRDADEPCRPVFEAVNQTVPAPPTHTPWLANPPPKKKQKKAARPGWGRGGRASLAHGPCAR